MCAEAPRGTDGAGSAVEESLRVRGGTVLGATLSRVWTGIPARTWHPLSITQNGVSKTRDPRAGEEIFPSPSATLRSI